MPRVAVNPQTGERVIVEDTASPAPVAAPVQTPSIIRGPRDPRKDVTQSIQLENLDLSRQSAARQERTQDRADIQLELQIAEADRKAKEAQANAAKADKDDPAQNALNIVNRIGIDLNDDNDRVSQLIRGSTSGALENFGARTFANITGRPTPGLENLGALRTIASDLTLEMTGGSLGNQISNADRDFIEQRMGAVGNPELTAGERLSAFREVKGRLRRILALQEQTTQERGTGQSEEAGSPLTTPPAISGDLPVRPNAFSAVPQTEIQEGFQTRTIPERVVVEQQFRSLLEQGVSPEEGVAFLRQNGITNPVVLEEAQQQLEFRRAFPTVPLNRFFTTGISTEKIPLNAVQETLTGAGENPFGAAALSAADSLLTQNTARFADDPQAFRANLARIREGSPVASFLGDVAGGTAGALGLGKILGAPGIASEAAFGGATGFGAGGEDAGVGDVLGGVLLGGGAARLGRGATRGAIETAVPTGGSLDARVLDAAGVSGITPGQRFAGTGIVGNSLNVVEEALGTVPLTGGVVRNARQVPKDSFQIATMGEALQPLGIKVPPNTKPGPALFRFADGKIDQAFRASERGMVFEVDAPFRAERAVFELNLDSVQTLGKGDKQTVVKIIKDNFDSRLSSGRAPGTRRGQAQPLQGPALTTAISDMEKAAARAGPRVLSEIKDFTTLVREAALRNPGTLPEAVELFSNARTAFSRLVVVRNAAARDATAKSTFTPSDLIQAVKTTDISSGKNKFLAGDARLQRLAEAGQSLENRVLPEAPLGRVQQSGGQAAASSAPSLGLGAVGVMGSPGLAATLLSPTLAFAPGARNVLSKLFTPRNSIRTRAKARRLKGTLSPRGGAVAEAAALSEFARKIRESETR